VLEKSKTDHQTGAEDFFLINRNCPQSFSSLSPSPEGEGWDEGE